ncbi:MAG: MOSC domain-containing protein [Gammaproteobacteria bacterium]
MQVASIGRVYVKATRFQDPDSVVVDADGIRHDRAFALVEADDKFVNSDQHRVFLPLSFDYDATADRLTLDLPDGRRLEGPAAPTGRRFAIDHFGLRTIDVAEVDGPWRAALSEFAGRPIGLVRCLSEGRALDVFPITLLTTGSLARLARELGDSVDAPRFRAGFVIEHPDAHAEDDWDGRSLKIGDAVLRVRTSVPRCAIPGFNPATGERDKDVMKSLMRYRDKVGLPDGMMPGYATPGFASYAEVLRPGRVRVGDGVELLP